ncbi:MAG: hypothetical protein DI533_12680 [Cereibacter sphaeroides]|uniref:Zinc finger/thioredoxin putative domain-containing protein n=1 Tax=Cereibacter sphaeroides TaxID=1063 RepID=A0A2W5UJ67_CERSP|nr:MAG: hypothetical protein DI533_12680 [Cereibacter sphaeroides]
MRLVCPNCDAQYEVDGAAIPEAGRDVQCSNCGHAWFQRHPEVEAEEEAAEEVFETEVTAQGMDALSEPMMDMTGEPEVIEPPAPPPSSLATEPEPQPKTESPTQRKLDESVLAVLREEAERETAVRRTEAPRAVEVQTDLGLQPPPPTVPIVPVTPPSVLAARERFKDLSADAEELAAEEDAAALAARPASRRELLPDIEEINSTLRASSEPRGEDDETTLPPPVEDRRQGFRSGFVLMIIIAIGLWMTYVMSPRIVAQIPASASAMGAYVEAVDKARVSVDAALQSASRSLRSLSGKDS